MTQLRSDKASGRASERGRFLRMADTIATTGLSRATLYRRIKDDDFPKQRRLTQGCVGWWEADVLAWMEARVGSADAA